MKSATTARRGRKSSLDAIVKAAVRCFMETGLDKASMSDIAAQANISRQALYGHFKNKHAIFSHIMGIYTTHTWSRVLSRMDFRKTASEIISESFEQMARYARTPLGRVLFDPRNRFSAVVVSQDADVTGQINLRFWAPMIDRLALQATPVVAHDEAFVCLNYLLIGFLTVSDPGRGHSIAGEVAARYIFGRASSDAPW